MDQEQTNKEINQALREFKANISKQEVNKSAKLNEPSGLTAWFVKYSGGLVKDEEQ